MYATTQPSRTPDSGVFQQQFLIVPIFFKKQIEAIIASQSPGYAFGFFYGDERENYRIIKKIWPIKKVDRVGGKVKITSRDFERANLLTEGTNLKLLGCFFTSENGGVRTAMLSKSCPTSFSFVKLRENIDGDNCTWIASLSNRSSNKVVDQKVIL